jgi:hypothetical protein
MRSAVRLFTVLCLGLALLPAGGCASVKGVVQTALAAVPGADTPNGASPYGAADPKLTAPNPTGGPANPFLANGNAILKALNAIAARSGRPLRIMNLEADTFNGLSAEVVEPRNHLHVDEYKIAIDGTMTGPFPVRLNGSDGKAPTVADVDYNSLDPRIYRFAGLTKAVREAIVKSKASDARVSSWQIDRAWGQYQWGLTMDAERSRPNVTLRPNATIENISY